MDPWVTLQTSDPRLGAYLDGSFSPSYRAIPQRLSHAQTKLNHLTFRIVRVEDCRPASLFRVWIKALRPQLLALTLAPVFVILALYSQEPWRLAWPLLLLSVLSLLFFQIGIHLFNDYHDHKSGVDRLGQGSGTQIIQKGWLPAYAFRRAALTCLVLSAVTGLPVIWRQPWTLGTMALAALVGGLEYTLDHWGRHLRGAREVVLWVLAGPTLTLTYSFLLRSTWGSADLFLGITFGFLAVTALHLKHLESIFGDTKAQRATLATVLGFEGSKKFLYALLACAWGGLVLMAIFTPFKIPAGLAAIGFLIVGQPLIRRVKEARSFASSELQSSHYLALRVVWSITSLMILGTFAEPYLPSLL